MRALIALAFVGLLHAQAPPSTINPGSPVASAIVNGNFQGLYNYSVRKFVGSGTPGNIQYSKRGDSYTDYTNHHLYWCYAVGPCTAVGAGNWTQVDAITGVSSVGLSAPSWFTVSGSPVTSTGTLSFAAATGQTPHLVIGTCGAATSFGPCALVAGDLPTIPIGGGGSGQTTQQAAFDALAPTATRAGDLTYWNGTHYVNLAGNNSGTNCFQENASGVPAWAACGSGTISGLTLNKIPRATSSTSIGDSSVTDDGTTVTSTEPIAAPSVATGTSPPSLTAGTGGAQADTEGTAPSVGPAAGVDVCYSDSTVNAKLCSYNNGSYYPLGRIIAHGSKALDFASTSTGACATVITDTATGALSTDVILFNANASIKAVTGYVPASTGGFSVAAFPTADTVNFEGCNWTSGTVDPGSITVNWMVIRI